MKTKLPLREKPEEFIEEFMDLLRASLLIERLTIQKLPEDESEEYRHRERAIRQVLGIAELLFCEKNPENPES